MRHLTPIQLNRVTKEITKILASIYTNADSHIEDYGNEKAIIFRLDFFTFLQVVIDKNYHLTIQEYKLSKNLRETRGTLIYNNKIPIDFKGNIKYDMISDFINQYNINKEFFKL